MVKEKNERHAEDAPINDIRSNEIEAFAARQQADNDHLCREDNDGVWMIPQHIGEATHQDGTEYPQAYAQQLQDQHGKDAAEEKVDAEKDGEAEVIAGEAQAGKSTKNQYCSGID